MQELKLPDKLGDRLQEFTESLKEIYQQDLVSLILYGSAASGEYVSKHSNLNILVVLKNTQQNELIKAAKLVKKFRMINPLFLTEDYIASSTDVFPIEFLDMQENYSLLFGKDVLKSINIDISNLRFQCEQELKSKLINLKHVYLRLKGNNTLLNSVLLKSFTSALHILRNVLRLKSNKAPYLKQEILEQLQAEFQIDKPVWKKILATKNKQIKLKGKDIDGLFISFIKELEKLIEIVDKL